MIDKELLEDLHKKRLSNTNKHGSTPKRMFVNGKFNKNNWCGGDDLIRNFFEDLFYNEIKNIYVLEEDDLYDAHIICHVDMVENQNYATIVINSDIYYFSWYKNRGCTEVATLNGNNLTEDKYIELLNIIEKTGYNYFK